MGGHRALSVGMAATIAVTWLLGNGPRAQEPPEARPPHANGLFETSTACLACHNGLVTASGEDVSIGSDWRASMMANAARDPYWQAAVRREIMDHPSARQAIEDKCATCHMPMARFQAAASGRTGQVFAHLPIGYGAEGADVLAADGVSCALCHQITDQGLGEPISFTGGFDIDRATGAGDRAMLGPYDVDAGRTAIMRSATGFRPTEAAHLQASEMCATCHTLYTHALGPDGEEVGELPEQMPYLEWRQSAFASERSCQSCHMPVVDDETAIASVLGEPRAEFSRHVFRGGNFFMLRMLNRFRAELGVTALPQELSLAADRTVAHLQSSTARVAIADAAAAAGALRVRVHVENLAGHKLPTAYPSRRVWLQLTVWDADDERVFESGALAPTGRIRGNDNDDDPLAYEPHHRVIDDPDDVQIYESLLADSNDAVTTGLLTGVRFIKDNRLLPRGFDKQTASADVAVHGGAASDADFRGGRDEVAYAVDVAGRAGPFTVEVRLWYQPIAFRWAQNLAEYDAVETNRFVAYYDAMAAGSAITLARAEATVP